MVNIMIHKKTAVWPVWCLMIDIDCNGIIDTPIIDGDVSIVDRAQSEYTLTDLVERAREDIRVHNRLDERSLDS